MLLKKNWITIFNLIPKKGKNQTLFRTLEAINFKLP